MAHSREIGPPISLIAGANIIANRLVKADTVADQGIHTAAITDVPYGVSLVSCSSGESFSVGSAEGSIYKMTAAAAIAAGATVMPDAGGSGKIATRAGATATCVGQAIEAALADGDVISVKFSPSAIGTA